ncbi:MULTISPECIES: hypothetical protein [unclassified Leptolyngbya]|uniref:hypothetical protein n=1 Tax=unclassified Leptolyngbya TaxID=2650499 RepID=UPI001683A852|nr:MULTISPECIES: hypothetical protein [unclassified Leptolyngbya]MBD1913510.1 hypothetical protein [Leptolyngbya sp. FACHB-8]MBD2153268.1 hypothetical protein [Leptolyngbya sp. FACHB-16]
MPSKSELQDLLKEKYGINKNISQSLTIEDCEQILGILQNQPSATRLVESFISKNSDLSQKNRNFGALRSQAEKKLEKLQLEYQELEKNIADLELAKESLGDRRQQLLQDHQSLESEINGLMAQNQELSSKVTFLSTQNNELVEANLQLKKDNKDLKNVVDQIRLKLAQDINLLLQYEDSEIRKAMIRLFRWTLG